MAMRTTFVHTMLRCETPLWIGPERRITFSICSITIHLLWTTASNVCVAVWRTTQEVGILSAMLVGIGVIARAWWYLARAELIISYRMFKTRMIKLMKNLQSLWLANWMI